MNPQTWAEYYASRGWQVVRIEPMQKGPRDKNWPDLLYPPESFTPGSNIGVKLGARSGGLLDIDLDCPEAAVLAPLFLPDTIKFGREGAWGLKLEHRASDAQPIARHWIYKTTGPARTERPKFLHIEFRADGCQTVFPGSVHETGYPIVWDGDPNREPTTVKPDEIFGAWVELSVAVYTARELVAAQRNRCAHDFLLALAGALYGSGWTEERATRAIMAGCSLVQGNNTTHREDCIKTTWHNEEKPRTGWPTLSDLVDAQNYKPTKALQKIVDIDRPPVASIPVSIDGPVSIAREYALSDIGNADRLLDMFGTYLRFVNGIGWLRWNQKYWERLPKGPYYEAEQVVRAMIKQARALPKSEAAILCQWAIKSGSAQRLRGCMEIASQRPQVLLDIDQLDADPFMLNTPGGTVDLRTGDLLPHDPERFCTKMTGVNCQPYPTPRFNQFLREVTSGDVGLMNYLLRWLGYSLTGSVSEQVFNIWHGPKGANGKSTLLSLVNRIMGDYSTVIAPSVLMAKQGDSHPTGTMDLQGRRFVVAQEADEGKRWNESLIKRLTGADPVKARFMHQDYVEFTPQAKIVLATNPLPVVRESGNAFWRRVHLVPWLRSFEKNPEQDLSEKLEREAQGILYILVQGCIAWQRGGLQPSQQMLDAAKQYRVSQDSLGAFLSTYLIPTPGAAAKFQETYDVYKFWADAIREPTLSGRVFQRVLAERGFSMDMGGNIYGYTTKKTTYN